MHIVPWDVDPLKGYLCLSQQNSTILVILPGPVPSKLNIQSYMQLKDDL